MATVHRCHNSIHKAEGDKGVLFNKRHDLPEQKGS